MNLFALRATKPSNLTKVTFDEAVRPENDAFLRAIPPATPVVLGWGSHAGILGSMVRYRARAVLTLLETQHLNLMRLGQAMDGSPRHPLLLPKDAQLQALRTAKESLAAAG